MRGIQLPLSQTQKIRLEKALEQLQNLSSKVNSDAAVTIADSIPVNYEDGVLKYSLSLSRLILYIISFKTMHFCTITNLLIFSTFLYSRGHGTADLNGEVVATLCGVVERVNKLVYVRALRSR